MENKLPFETEAHHDTIVQFRKRTEDHISGLLDTIGKTDGGKIELKFGDTPKPEAKAGDETKFNLKITANRTSANDGTVVDLIGETLDADRNTAMEFMRKTMLFADTQIEKMVLEHIPEEKFIKMSARFVDEMNRRAQLKLAKEENINVS